MNDIRNQNLDRHRDKVTFTERFDTQRNFHDEQCSDTPPRK